MIDINDISKIIEDSKTMELDITVKDIAYQILLRTFKNKDVVYTTLYGKDFTDDDLALYDKSKRMKFLKKYLDSNFSQESTKSGKKLKDKNEDISFEENKSALIEKLKEIEAAKVAGVLEYKDAIKMEVDIRTKLNDKFEVSDKQNDQYVVVEPKFNHICERLGAECWLQTKEFAMEHWNLVDKEELEQKYNLIPKGNNGQEN